MATKKKAKKAAPKKSKMVNLKLTRDEANRLMSLCIAVYIPRHGDGNIQCLTPLPTEATRGGGLLNTIDCIVTDKLSKLGAKVVW